MTINNCSSGIKATMLRLKYIGLLTFLPNLPAKSVELKTTVFCNEVVVFSVLISTSPSNVSTTSNLAPSSPPPELLYLMPHSNVKSVASLPSYRTLGPTNVGGDMLGYNTVNNDTTVLCDWAASTGQELTGR